MDLAMRILGGEGANRLHRVLRMERALTYGASAEMETLKRAGQFVAITNTRSEATGEVLRLIVEEFSRLHAQRVGDQELADAKAYLTGNFPLRIETPDDIAMQVLNVLFYDLPVEELQTYRQRVNTVTADDIGRVTNAYLHPDRLAVVLVGNAKAFVNQLKAVGFDQYEVIPASDLDLTAADLRRHAAVGGGSPVARLVPIAYSEDVRGAPVDPQERARSVLQHAIEARGGADSMTPVDLLIDRSTGMIARERYTSSSRG
jgi:zinc protease